MPAENIQFSIDPLTKPTAAPGALPFQSYKSREIMSFADLEARLKLIPMDDNIRKNIVKRVRVYPEASLDYVWTNLQSFINAAIKELHPKAETVELKPLAEIEPETKPVEKAKSPPIVVRPSIMEKITAD